MYIFFRFIYEPKKYCVSDVDFCVAQTYVMGKVRASKSGTGNKYRLPRFLFLLVSIFRGVEMG